MGRLGSKLRILGFWLRAAAFTGLLGSASVAHAQAPDSADDMARRHFESGVAYLEESDYENALRAFQKAYDLSKRPEILLNIAVVEERRGEVAHALAALRQYLAEAPKDADLETVKLRIQNLEKRKAAESERSAPASAPPTAAPPPTATPTPAPAPVTVQPSPPNRTPMLTAFGVGAVATGVAVVTGILANSEYQNEKSDCSPRCSDGDLSSGRALALTSTVFTGLAVAGVGVGITLLLLEKPGAPSADSLALTVSPSLDGARAGAAWRF